MPRIIIPGSYQSQATRYSPPDTDGLEYWGMFGTSDVFTGRNHAPGKAGALVAGSPSYATDYMTITPSAEYVATSVSQSPEQSFIAVAKVTVEASVGSFITNGPGPSAADGTSSRGARLSCNAGTAGSGKTSLVAYMSMRVGTTDTSFNATLAETLALDTWACFAGVVQSNGQYKIYNLSAATSAVATATSPYNPAITKYRIGTSYTPNSDPISMAMAAIYSTAKTDAQLADIYGVLKAYYAKRGISI